VIPAGIAARLLQRGESGGGDDRRARGRSERGARAGVGEATDARGPVGRDSARTPERRAGAGMGRARSWAIAE
jgi:hypothetical protein